MKTSTVKSEPKKLDLHDEVESKRLALSEEFKKEVFAVVIPGRGDDAGKDFVGYFFSPNRMTKMVAIDKMTGSSSLMQAGEAVMNACIIKDHSCPEMQMGSKNDAVYLGCCLACSKKVDIYYEEVKKK